MQWRLTIEKKDNQGLAQPLFDVEVYATNPHNSNPGGLVMHAPFPLLTGVLRGPLPPVSPG